jgi:hypothetical protein
MILVTKKVISIFVFSVTPCLISRAPSQRPSLRPSDLPSVIPVILVIKAIGCYYGHSLYL